MRRRPALPCALVLCGASLLTFLPAQAANLLTNGSFEGGAFVNQGNDTMSLATGSTTITAWTVITDTTAWIGPTNPFGLSASEGSMFLDLTNYETGAPFAGVRQTIDTVAGATYELSFDLGSSNFWGRPDSITASAGNASQTFTSPPTGTNNDWTHETMQFIATGSSTTVVLQGASGVKYIGLDNADVELVSLPVPEPATGLLLVGGLALLGAARRSVKREREK